MTILVVGNGIAGQAAALALLERGVPVEIVTRSPATATESVARRGGLDVDDDPERHARDVESPLFEEVAREANAIFDWLRNLDVPFASTRARSLKASVARTAHVGSETARHVSRRLAARLRHFGCLPRENRELVRLVLDANVVRGAIFRDLRTGRLEGRAASAVCLATGGHAGLYDAAHPFRGRGAAVGRVFRQGAILEVSGSVALELGWDRSGIPCALSETLLTDGATLRNDDGPIEIDPVTTSFHDLAVRAGEAAVLERRGEDPLHTRPIPARSLTALAVSEGEASSIEGLFAVGGASARFQREKCHGGNALLVDLHASRKLAERLAAADESHAEAEEIDVALVAAAEERLSERRERARDADGESPSMLQKELALSCRKGATEAALADLAERLRSSACPDANLAFSREFGLLLELEDALLVARAVAFSAGEPARVRCSDDGRLERLESA